MAPDDFLDFVFAVTFSEQIISQVSTANHSYRFLNNFSKLLLQKSDICFQTYMRLYIFK